MTIGERLRDVLHIVTESGLDDERLAYEAADLIDKYEEALRRIAGLPPDISVHMARNIARKALEAK